MSAAFVVYGCTFCHGYIANVYGPSGHLIALVAVGLLQRIILCGSANPLPHIAKLVECSNPCDVRFFQFPIAPVTIICLKFKI